MRRRAFRFGVKVRSAAGAGAWRAQARAMEDLGYDTLVMPDHPDDQWAPLVALAAAAAATTTIRLGTMVLANDFRHPAVLAKELATLDVLSEGRLEVGMGAGWQPGDYETLGLAFDPPAARVARLEAAVPLLKARWADGLPPPAQRPHPPVLVAGGGRRVLALAAREADIVGFNTTLAAGAWGPEAARAALAGPFRERVEWVREQAGERFGALELHCNTAVCMVGADPRAMAEAMAPGLDITPEEALDVPMALVGSVDQLCETLERRRELFGFSYWCVPAASAEAFAPVIARLAGR
ncbi:MAG TPA: TIGR03621 family F420-dependent LLM class oxidoreductase [Acidimicrobiales bacterium]|nr:TIGR03621 family F420-dependent LLM class oxidoreductase [Acidimicrobiales bacterium]